MAILAKRYLGGQHVALALDGAIAERGRPVSITVDNGSGLASRVMDTWAHRHGVQLAFIRQGRPTENGFIESFNGRLRDECQNVELFGSPPGATSPGSCPRTHPDVMPRPRQGAFR